MPPSATAGRRDLSTVEAQALLLIGDRVALDRPIQRGPELADLLRVDEPTARRVVARLELLHLLHEVDEPVPRRLLIESDVPPLDHDPARPSAEGRRRDLEVYVYLELLARWLRGWTVRDTWLPGPVGSPLLPDTRRTILQRLRDPARAGGALLWPYGALVLTRAGEAARGALLHGQADPERVGSPRAAS